MPLVEGMWLGYAGGGLDAPRDTSEAARFHAEHQRQDA